MNKVAVPQRKQPQQQEGGAASNDELIDQYNSMVEERNALADRYNRNEADRRRAQNRLNAFNNKLEEEGHLSYTDARARKMWSQQARSGQKTVDNIKSQIDNLDKQMDDLDKQIK